MDYDAFISYSHAADGRLAPAVQNGLQRLAKPWWRPRALRAFRDETGLSVNPDLWRSIQTALRSSEWFVLLCSPEAAASAWVNKEVDTWFENRPAEQILPVLTDGAINWDADARDFTEDSTAIPPSLRGRYAEAPRYLDLRWARTETELDLRNSRFRAGIATIAAPIHGMTRDQLDSEDVRIYRRSMRLARVGVATVATLLVLLGVAVAIVTGALSESHQLKKARNSAVAEAARAASNAARAQTAEGAAVRNAAEAQRAKATAQKEAKLAEFNRVGAEQNAKRAVSEAAAADASARLAAIFGKRSQENADAATAAKRLAVANAASTSRQRVAGVATQLVLGSQLSLNVGSTDTALLLLAQATKFASLSGGLIAKPDLRPALINALQANPSLVGWLRGLSGSIAAVAPDNSRAAAISKDGVAAVWDLASRQILSTFAISNSSDVVNLRFVDADTLVFASLTRLSAYHATTGGAAWVPTWTSELLGGRLISTIATARGQILIATLSTTKSYLDVFGANGHRLREVVIPELVDRVAFAPSGAAVATAGRSLVGNGFVVRVVSLQDGAPIWMRDLTPTNAISTPPGLADLRFSGNGRQVTILLDGDALPIRRFDIPSGSKLPVPIPNGGWQSVVPNTPIGLSPNLDAIVQRDPNNQNHFGIGRIAAGTFTGNLEAPVAPSAQPPAFTPDGQMLLMAGGVGAVPVFTVDATRRLGFATTQTVEQPSARCFDCSVTEALSPDGRTLATMSSGPTGRSLRITTLDRSRSPVQVQLFGSAEFDSDMFNSTGDEIAVLNGDASVDVFETATGAWLLHLQPPGTCPSNLLACLRTARLVFTGSSDDGRLVESEAGTVTTWAVHLRFGKLIARSPIHFGAATAIGALGINASGSRLVVESTSRSDGETRAHVFEATTDGWRERHSFVVAGGDVSLSADGSQLIETSGSSVTSYDVDRGVVKWRTPGDDTGARFGRDGSLYAASPGTALIRVRSATDGSVQYALAPTVPQTSSGFFDAPPAFALVGPRLVAAWTEPIGSRKILVTNYNLATTDLVVAACNAAGRNLTVTEWKQFVGPVDAYEQTCPGFA